VLAVLGLPQKVPYNIQTSFIDGQIQYKQTFKPMKTLDFINF